MIRDVVGILQQVASIWLAVVVLYSSLNEGAKAAERRNRGTDPYRQSTISARPVRVELLSALVFLILTIATILL